MPENYLIGVDIGTYSSKGVLVKTDGTLVASSTLPHGMDMPRPGFFEHDADAVWWHDFVTIVQSLLHEPGIMPNQVLGIGTSAIGSCVLPIDENGRPLRPAILYGIDTRASQECEFLERELGTSATFKGGLHLDSQASGPKILWIRNNEPEVYARARWYLTSQAYLVYKLTGKASIDVYTAGGYSPLYDPRERTWVEEAAALIVPLERLPHAYWSCEVVGLVTSSAARETGLAEGTPVIAGTTDAAAEAISAGMADFGDMMVMFGSSIFFILKTPELTTPRHFWSSNFLEPGTFAFTGGMSTSGSLTTWFANQFGQHDIEDGKVGGPNVFAELAGLAAASRVGSNGLVALPYFEGERTPIHDPKAKGVWFGLSLKHTKGDLYRAILEAVAFGIRHNFEQMAEEGAQPRRILAVGGGTKNALWLQIVADACNVKLNVPDQQIGASYGDAFLAAVGLGLYDNLVQIKQWVKVKDVVKPDARNWEEYDFHYRVFRDLYNTTKPLMHRLTDHQL
ncbi:MAG TPA: FGGY-family carbohydrate kinase, partial [Aggregatilineaceae bacterium]|nr:FGGY-family carbohydrate kinase [Aggregatilineaceae bacterium]